MKKSLLIGIAGGSASGKTSVAKKVCDYFKVSNSVYILKQDDYYKDQSHLSMDQRTKTNYDHPMAFDTELMISQITDLVNGKMINKPTYDYTIHTRSDVVEKIVPAEVIIIEGLFALENAAIRDMCDLKIFVDTDSDIRLIRRMMRDINERGRSLESIVTQYQESVRDMHIQFVEPTKRFADVIIPEGGNNEVAIDLIITKISSILD